MHARGRLLRKPPIRLPDLPALFPRAELCQVTSATAPPDGSLAVGPSPGFLAVPATPEGIMQVRQVRGMQGRPLAGQFSAGCWGSVQAVAAARLRCTPPTWCTHPPTFCASVTTSPFSALNPASRSPPAHPLQALVTTGPVVHYFNATPAFKFYSGGIWPASECAETGSFNHAMVGRRGALGWGVTPCLRRRLEAPAGVKAPPAASACADADPAGRQPGPWCKGTGVPNRAAVVF